MANKKLQYNIDKILKEHSPQLMKDEKEVSQNKRQTRFEANLKRGGKITKVEYGLQDSDPKLELDYMNMYFNMNAKRYYMAIHRLTEPFVYKDLSLEVAYPQYAWAPIKLNKRILIQIFDKLDKVEFYEACVKGNLVALKMRDLVG